MDQAMTERTAIVATTVSMEPETCAIVALTVTPADQAAVSSLADAVTTTAIQWQGLAGLRLGVVAGPVWTAPEEERAAREINTPEVRKAIAAALQRRLEESYLGDESTDSEALAGAVFVILNRASAGLDLETGR